MTENKDDRQAAVEALAACFVGAMTGHESWADSEDSAVAQEAIARLETRGFTIARKEKQT